MNQGSSTGSFTDSIKNFFANFNMKQLSQKFGGNSAEAIQAVLYFGLFFALGFLSKKYFKFVVTVLISSILLIKFMEYNSLVMIDWIAIKKLSGISKASDINSLLNMAFAWIKQNILLTVASSVGFLIGYKLG